MPNETKQAAPGKFLRKKENLRSARPAKHRRSRIGWKEILIIALPAVAAVAAVCIALATVESGSSYSLPDNGKQYFGGVSAKVEIGEKLELNGENQGVPEGSSDAVTLALPIYLENSDTIVLTADMMYYTPRTGQFYRAATFSEVNRQKNGMITVTRDGKKINPEEGFLYDGSDLYIFLEPVEVRYMGETLSLSALSYAKVTPGVDLILFNYETKESTIVPVEGTVEAATPMGDYVISLMGDSMTDYNGQKSLLVTRPDLYDPMV